MSAKRKPASSWGLVALGVLIGVGGFVALIAAGSAVEDEMVAERHRAYQKKFGNPDYNPYAGPH